MLHPSCDSLTTLMTVWLAMTFKISWLSIIHVCPLDFHFTIHFEYTWSTMMMWPITTHYMTWNFWHELLDDVVVSCHYCYCVSDIWLRIILSSTSSWFGDKESSIISSLWLWSQIGVPLIFLDWSAYMSSWKDVFKHDSFLHVLLHYLIMVWESNCICNSLMARWHHFEKPPSLRYYISIH